MNKKPPLKGKPLPKKPLQKNLRSISLFRRVNSHFYDLGVRGIPKILKSFLGGFAQSFEKVNVLPDAAKRFCLPPQSGSSHVGASRLRGLRRFAAAGKTLSRHQATRSLFSKFWTKPLRNFSKFWWYP